MVIETNELSSINHQPSTITINSFPSSPSVKPKLLIVDDDEEIRTQMKWAVGQDYDVLLAGDRVGALETFSSLRPAVTILDLGLPPRPNEPEEGLATLSDLLALDRTAKVIIISGQEEKENALRAVGAGAYDFLCKPVEIEQLKFLLRRCFYVANLEKAYRDMQQSLEAEVFEGILGTSPQMQGVFAAIRKVATASAPVLLLGESGTGKEMAAEAIHRRSLRKDGPLSRSIAMPSRRTFLKASFSDMKRVPLLALICSEKVLLKALRRAPCFSMRSATCPFPSR